MVAAVFPGQGSQRPGMGAGLFDLPAAAPLLAEISAAAGLDVRRLCLQSDEDALRQTQNAQMALFACGVVAFRCLEDSGVPKPAFFAGHSVGEYAALVASGALGVADGARLVARRGELMASAGKSRPGGMAAVLGLDGASLETACREASTGGEVAVVANDNCPGQLVISGDTGAVRRACDLATARGAKRAMPLNVSGAFHSPLMEEAAAAMFDALVRVTFKAGAAPVVSNVTAAPVDDPSRWPELLRDQLRSPVRWTESVQRIAAAGVDAFLECGAGEVLCGLIRRTTREARTLPIYDQPTLEAAVAELGARV
ncbi:MAG: ACP S-malonyltransferase [Fimbriimonas ginsengisoli]|uniref:Malonyl CoA-acyl carrier protein transacylase n=1 Tax=Fimbriimonas ginsengisoli TaxID=1005039 RepID=A0A931LZ38_FIMGI|nr:ACP S-malonyltransferase [Fimbriimonas ginsengisoli]MBI3721450.1 ACP S-malonyltransferase [Fimbriimonas ginsengisoli]